ncbi:hypothetical protein [Rhizobium leguminosarum]|uniref:Uncharacterized protein n=1 Tax=Rhizobium leguminosarum TaxID=384 RepID=A0A7M3DW40_RHILE|nr:hypothetical protein [Rhizobium leguminosarum]NKK44939.1 hypothetical protein [Rhizobium leguminosarum bv. viciae]TAY52886.1 hypothetical protein ELH90_15210 [Rhizobium leguminosarum]
MTKSDVVSCIHPETHGDDKGVREAYRLIVAEVSQLRRAKQSIETQLEKAEAAKEALRQLLATGLKNEAARETEKARLRPRLGRPKGFYIGSQTAEVVSRSKEILLAAGHPLQRAELLERIEASGFLVETTNPAKFIGRTLWESADFVHIPKRGYWLKGKEFPNVDG